MYLKLISFTGQTYNFETSDGGHIIFNIIKYSFLLEL
jgi:hypothetical protein